MQLAHATQQNTERSVQTQLKSTVDYITAVYNIYDANVRMQLKSTVCRPDPDPHREAVWERDTRGYLHMRIEFKNGVQHKGSC